MRRSTGSPEGTPSCLAVEGEPGIGKTRLLAELRDRAEARGHLVLAGAGGRVRARRALRRLGRRAGRVRRLAGPADASWDAELLAELGGRTPAARAAGATGRLRVADERYRAHRAVRSAARAARRGPGRWCSCSTTCTGPTRASIELIARAAAARARRRRSCSPSAFRPGQAPERLTAALAAPGVRAARARRSSARPQAAELLGERRPGGRRRRSTATAAATRSTSSSSPAPAARAGCRRRCGARATARRRGRCPPPWRASLAEELESLSLAARALLNGAAVAGEPFEPDLAAAIAELSEAEGLAALDDLLALDLVRPTQVPRALRLPPPARAAGGLRVHAAAAGGWPRTRARPPRWRPAAPPPPSAPTTSSSRPARATRQAIALLLEAGEATAAARARRPRRAGSSRAAPAAGRRPRAPGRRARVAGLGAALARASSSAAARRCWRRSSCCPPTSAARRVELTALCAAVEHWLGRHDEAHRAPHRARGTSCRPHDPAEAAALQIELAVDGLYELDFEQTLEHGPRRARDRARAGRPAADRRGRVGARLGEAAAGQIDAAREHRDEALRADRPARRRRAGPAARGPLLPRLGRELPRALRRRRSRTPIAASRSRAPPARAGCCVPMMLVKGYPFEMQGRLAEAIELCETRGRGARALGQPALPLLGAVRAGLGALLRRATSMP